MSQTEPTGDKFISVPRSKCLACSHQSGYKIHLPPLPQPLPLLRSNFTPPSPSSLSRLSIESTILKSKVDAFLLTYEIARLRTVLSAMETRLEEVQTFIVNQSSLLAPVRRVPVEILGDIFLRCSDSTSASASASADGAGGCVAVCNPETFVKTITQVCTHWRAVAISLPLLWSKIDVDFRAFNGSGAGLGGGGGVKLHPQTMGRLLTMIPSFLTTCITRSHPCPLSFSFSRNCTRKILGDALHTLSSHAWRWEDVSATLEVFVALCESITEGDWAFPSLRSLDVISDYAPVECLEFMDYAPLLTRLTLRTISNPRERLRLPWKQITHLHLDECTLENGELRGILQLSSPHLTTLEFSGDSGIPDGPSTTALRLPKLTSLTLSTSTANIPRFLALLTAPNLKSLSIKATTSHHRQTISPQPIIHFIRLSRCALSHLSLRDISLHDSNDPLFFDAIASVSALDLGMPSLSEMRDVQMLTWDTNTNHVLPKIDTLTLAYDGKPRVSELITMIRSRTRSRASLGNDTGLGTTTTLKNVKLLFGQELDPHSLMLLREFKEEKREQLLSLDVKHNLRRLALVRREGR